MAGIDLHSHTSFSDGPAPPAGSIALAAERGLDVLAITDHDTLDGLREAVQGVVVGDGQDVEPAFRSQSDGTRRRGRSIGEGGMRVKVDPGHGRGMVSDGVGRVTRPLGSWCASLCLALRAG